MDIKELSGSLNTVYRKSKLMVDIAETKQKLPDAKIGKSKKTDEQPKIIDGSQLNAGNKRREYDIFDVSSISVRLAREIAMFKGANKIEGITIEEKLAKYPEISDEFVNTIIAAGKTIPKIDENYDDLAWGMLVTIGNQVGLSNPEVLMELTGADLAMYFDEKYHKTDDVYEILGNTDQNGNPVKKYNKPEDIWRDIFQTAPNGEFIRGNSGTIMRNMDFERTQSSVGYRSYFSGTWGGGKLSYSTPGDLLTYSLSLEAGDSYWFRSTLQNNPPGAGPAVYHSKGLNKMNEVDKMINYKSALINGYRNMKDESSLYASPKGQHEEMIGVLDRGNEMWLTYKPFRGKGIHEYLPQFRSKNDTNWLKKPDDIN